MKRIIELSIKGVGLALALFAVFGLVADVANQGVFKLQLYQNGHWGSHRGTWFFCSRNRI